MLRFTEVGLFLVPFALYVAWRVLGPRLPRMAVWVAAVLMLVMIAGTFWFGLTNRLEPEEAYAPAHLENGVIIGGHGVSK